MKILKLRFANINSLKGEWEIDFSHNDFVSDGIFAICGPTGSGKSSVLDAICIALYGQTPRVGKISENFNHVMTRNTGEFFSELVFETSGKRYIVNFRQRRAKKSPNGKLQSPKHDIADFDTGKIISEKIRDVAVSVEEITGMDFHRFTRSMLLAQNRFSDFLQADADERAPMLEQITGSEIYSEISRKVHEINKENRIKLDNMKKEIEGINILSENELNDLNAGLNEIDITLSDKKKRIDFLEKGIELYNKKIEFEKEKENLLIEFDKFEIEWNDFRERLVYADKIDKAAEFGKFLGKRADYIDEEKKIRLIIQEKKNELEKKIPFLKSSEKRLEFFKRVYPVDLRLKEINDIREFHQNIKKSFLREISDLDKQNEDLLNDVKKSDSIIKELETFFYENRKADIDDTSFGSLNSLYSENMHYYSTLKDLKEDNIKLYKEIDSCEKSAASLSDKMEKEKESLCVFEKELEEVLLSLKKESGGKEKRDLYSEKEKMEKTLKNLELVKKSLYEIRKYKDELSKNTDLIDKKNSDLKSETERKTLLHEKIEKLKSDISRKEILFIEMSKINNMDKYRKELENGKECPLCGSTHHPYIDSEKIAEKNEDLKQFEQHKILLESILCEEKEVDNDIIRLNKDIEFLNKDIDRLKISIEKQDENIRELNVGFYQVDDIESLDSIISENSGKIENIAGNIAEMEKGELTKDNIEKNISGIREKITQLENENRIVYEKIKDKKGNIEKNLKNITLSQEKITFNNQKITEITGLKIIDPENSEKFSTEMRSFFEVFNSIRKKKILYTENLRKMDIVKVNIGNVKTRISDIRNKLESTDKELMKIDERYSETIFEKEKIINEFKDTLNLLEFINGDLITSDIFEYEKDCFDKLRTDTSELEFIIREKILSEKETEKKISDIDFEISQKMRDSVFSDIDEIILFYSKQDEKKIIESRKEELLKRKEIVESKLDSCKKSVENITDLLENPDYDNLDNIREEAVKLKSEYDLLNQKKGAYKEKIIQNSKLMIKFGEKSDEIRKMNEYISDFSALHELIGSADGKKFRNFAQGLTFEIVVKFANFRLKDLTDRYFLIRDRENPLELNIIDNYHGGIIRSVKNLSGGESFLVSLALALGLSEMNSGKIRVDSLFLDEGFGTLDENSLHTALNTLASLRHTGKTIGIISHIQSIKDRIPVHITVSHTENGLSGLSGPGVRGLN